MRNVWILAGIFLWAGLHAAPASAAYVTGADLSRRCQSSKSEDIFSCMNYVAGVIDYHIMLQSLGTMPAVDFCLPETLPIAEAAVTVMEYLKRAPQNNSFIAAPAVMMALQESYPCATAAPRKKKKKR